MDEHTVEGAIAAGKYFMSLYPYIYATGDLSEWNDLSDGGCGFCNKARDHVTQLHESGGYSLGGGVEIYAQNGGGPYEEGVYIVELGVRFEPSEQVHRDGTRASFDGGKKPELSLSMLWRSDQWIVLGVLTDPSQLDSETKS